MGQESTTALPLQGLKYEQRHPPAIESSTGAIAVHTVSKNEVFRNWGLQALESRDAAGRALRTGF